MSFNDLKAVGHRKAFTMVRLYLDQNDPSLSAELSLESDSCDTPKTTDDIRAYTGVDFKVYQYADQNIVGVDHFPQLASVQTSPPKIEPGKSIGFRATAKVNLFDFISTDAFELQGDYSDRRVTGSHFQKLKARNYLINRKAEIVRGFNPDNYSSANTQVETYVIDSISDPAPDGSVTLNLVDHLILVEDKQAKAPTVSRGVLTSTFTTSDPTLSYSSTITDEYGAVSDTVFIVIGKELIECTVTSSTVLAVVNRAQGGTELAEHASGETIQKCIVYNDENIIDIITDLITSHTKIPVSYIPTADWVSLKANELSAFNLSRTIHKPTDVKKLLTELIVLAGLSMYVDVINNELVIVPTPDFATSVITFDEDEHLIMDSVSVRDDKKSKITRQSLLWDKVSVTESDDENNYRKSFQVIDAIVEQEANEGVVSEAKTVKSNWLINTTEDNSLATNYCQRQVNRFSHTPKQVKFKLDQRHVDQLVSGDRFWLGSIFDINTSKIKDQLLNNKVTTCQCIQINPTNDDKWQVTGLSYIAAAPPIADLYINEDQEDYVLSDHLTTTEAIEYVVVVGAGVIISASSTSAKAFTTGSLFAGATIKIINLGFIVGAGGKGGNGALEEYDAESDSCLTPSLANGSDGGDALNLTVDTTVDNGFGFIGGGGGGGVGTFGSCDQPSGVAVGGDGGGGGQGLAGGAGGNAGTGLPGPVLGNIGIAGTFATKGGNGGEFGENGQDFSGATGGAAGDAIVTNGNTVTILSGNNSEQIKGAVN